MKKFFDSRWFWLIVFVFAWCALRLFWITCDSGVPATWEYGFHTTDEGYYLCGGKEMYLWGSFVNLTRQEALNYCYSYGTHWLSYLAHLCFGLSTWSWRLPFTLLYFLGWLLMFRHVSRRSSGWFAFATCLAASSVPLVLTYERCASNDATIAALTAIAFALAAGKERLRIFASALALSAIATIKPSVWALLPVVLSSLLEERKTRSRGLDAILFVVTTVVLVFCWKGLAALTVLKVAHANGLSAGQALAQVNATYGLPSILDLARDFRALASFPRDPAVRTMGPLAILITVVPGAMLFVNILRRKWNGHLLLYLAIPLYAFALNVINSMYTHYFLPLVILLPALVLAIRSDFADLAQEKVNWKPFAGLLALIVAFLGIAFLFLISASFDLKEALPLYSRIYNLPKTNPWRLTGPFLALGTAIGVIFISVFRGLRALRREGWLWAAVLFLTLSVAFAALPAAIIAPRVKLDAAAFQSSLAMNLAVGALFAFVVFVRPAALARPLVAAALLVLPVVVSYVTLPTWRHAAAELVTRRGHHDAELAAELAKLLPKDAVLLGERSDQALMSLPIRAVSTFSSGSNPIPFIERIRKENPNTPLYALIDPQCPYNYKHFKKREKEYRLDLIRKFRMPSTESGQMGDIYLVRVVCL